MKKPEIASPCVGICRLNDESTYCVGCYRSLEEIRAWPKLRDGARLDLLEQLKERRRKDGKTSPRLEKKRRRQNRHSLRHQQYTMDDDE